jgi:hypothetical protein
MQASEISYRKDGIFIIVETSLMNKIRMLLSMIQMSSDNMSQSIYNKFYNLRKVFYDNIKNTAALYIPKNREFISEIYDILNNRIEWEHNFVLDYNIYFADNCVYYPLPEIEEVLEQMNYVAAKLSEIINFDYVKMKKDNMNFAEDLAKYVFHPKRIINICEKYGVEDFYLKTKLFDIHDYVVYLDLLDP